MVMIQNGDVVINNSKRFKINVYVDGSDIGYLNDSRANDGKNSARPSSVRLIYTKFRASYVVLCMTIILIVV